jgi:hypothetical protein
MAGSRFLERRQVSLFFLLSLFAWTIWIPQAAQQYGLIGWAPSRQSPLNFLTVWSPGLAAMLVTALTLGRARIGDLFSTLGHWRVSPWLYAFAILFDPPHGAELDPRRDPLHLALQRNGREPPSRGPLPCVHRVEGLPLPAAADVHGGDPAVGGRGPGRMLRWFPASRLSDTMVRVDVEVDQA